MNVATLLADLRAQAKTRVSDAPQEFPPHPATLLNPLGPPPPWVPDAHQTMNSNRLQPLIARAWRETEVKSWVPKFLRRLFRKQGAFNKSLLEFAQTLVNENQQARQRHAELMGYLQTQHDWMKEGWSQAEHYRVLLEEKIATQARLQADEMAQIRERLVDQIQTATTAADSIRAGLALEAGARETAERSLDEVRDTTTALRRGLEAEAGAREAAERQSELQHLRVDLVGQRLDSLAPALARVEERQISEFAYLKRELQMWAASTGTLARTDSGSDKTVADTVKSALSTDRFDAFYVAFEDAFRGSRAVIKDRVATYLPWVREVGAGTAEFPVVDIGCGRGEWLEILRENDLVGRGVDLNEFMVAECAGRGLQAVREDALTHLRSQASESVGMITGMHIIEHLPFAILMELFQECVRVLRPGGMVAFETPNPDNVLVGSNRFYTDPTHLRPLPKEFARFVASTAGFAKVEIFPLHPDEGAIELGDTASAFEQRVHEMFFGCQDYIVTGRK